MNDSDCCLYLITPPRFERHTFAFLLSKTLDVGGIAYLQLRLKEADDDTIRRACETLHPIAQERDITFLLNDRPDLAREMNCDGVHIGQEDLSYVKARARVGNDAIIGVTCHDFGHLAIDAANAGANYVAFGAFYPTLTKKPKRSAKPAILNWWKGASTVPCVAIGGITVNNCRPLIKAGADFLAISSGIWNHPEGPAVAVSAFNRALQ